MILTITLNPAVDFRYSLPDFQLGATHRVTNFERTAGGKGLNATSALALLGHKNMIATGFLGGKNGDWISGQLFTKSVYHRFIPIEGDTRSCFAVISEGKETRILEPGPTVSKIEVASFISMYYTLLKKVDIVVASGSLPSGLPSNFYSTLGNIAREQEKYFILDADIENFEEGIQSRPYLVKTDEARLCEFAGKQLTVDEMVDQALNLCQTGINSVLVSLKDQAALLVSGSRAFIAITPKITVANTIGTGNSRLAGAVHALDLTLSDEDVLRWACACGLANAVEEQTAFINVEKVRSFLEQVVIEQIR